ncbi:entericidin A/B family lipoprotein [Ruegeria sediminis]|uniref:Entericidin A/B family lipoprotein n=1 Tax=Ruegeria sediminis TaxID=2583820 RepID=A0ABY2X445_9RHOB|nr:entericidin A/B family lipoprotein [Ruegeria sediminis]TMV09744.1 entericidin A/B family lipoprotein [Ruegeria sediminis]
MIRTFLIGLTLLTLAACETAKGAGRDIRKAGDAIEDVAGDIQRKF